MHGEPEDIVMGTRMTLRPLRAACVGVALLFSIAALAQTPDVAPTVQDNAPAPTVPTAGMTMEQVEQLLGPPKERLAPIGNPPITRWVYDAYTVYFEKQRVIHTVAHRK